MDSWNCIGHLRWGPWWVGDLHTREGIKAFQRWEELEQVFRPQPQLRTRQDSSEAATWTFHFRCKSRFLCSTKIMICKTRFTLTSIFNLIHRYCNARWTVADDHRCRCHGQFPSSQPNSRSVKSNCERKCTTIKLKVHRSYISYWLDDSSHFIFYFRCVIFLRTAKFFTLGIVLCLRLMAIQKSLRRSMKFIFIMKILWESTDATGSSIFMDMFQCLEHFRVFDFNTQGQ